MVAPDSFSLVSQGIGFALLLCLGSQVVEYAGYELLVGIGHAPLEHTRNESGKVAAELVSHSLPIPVVEDEFTRRTSPGQSLVRCVPQPHLHSRIYGVAQPSAS